MLPAVQEILLQEIDPASDDVDPEQMYMYVDVCVFVDALAQTFKFVKSFSFCPNNDNNNVQVIYYINSRIPCVCPCVCL